MLRDIFRNQLLIRQVGNVTHHAGYKELWLGYSWSYIEPLVFAIAYYFFVRLVRGGDAGDTKTLVLTIISGQAVYDWFNKVVSGSPGTIEKYQNILLTMNIKPILLIAADFWYYFKSCTSRFILLFGFLIALGVFPTWRWVLFFPLLAWFGFFLFPLGVILAVFGVYVKDVGKLMATVARLMIFVTPVLFSVEHVHNTYRTLIDLNPLTQMIEGLRDILMRATLPPLYGILYVMLLSLIFWGLAGLLIRKFGPYLAKEL